MWHKISKCDPRAVAIADRHYSRQTKGAQVGQPGRCLTLLTSCGRALFVWNYPYEQYAFHGYGDRQVCTLFRNEGAGLSSELILAAEILALEKWGRARDGFLTYVDAGKVRRKRDPGRCFIRAGYGQIGVSTRGLLVFGKP